jgi:hypothetical protein
VRAFLSIAGGPPFQRRSLRSTQSLKKRGRDCPQPSQFLLAAACPLFMAASEYLFGDSGVAARELAASDALLQLLVS